MNINDVVIGINNALEKNFPEAEIYNEAVKQGIDPPCFFVSVLNTITEKGLCKTYTDNIFFDVQYFNELDGDSNKDFMRVQDKLLRSIEYIQLEDGKIVRLNNRKVKKVNDILHYFFDVDIGLIEITEDVKMRDLEKEGVVNE